MKNTKLLFVTLLMTPIFLASCGGGGTPEPEYDLEFTLNADKESYAVTKITYKSETATRYDVVIPDTYNDLPVTVIGIEGEENNVFTSDVKIKTIKMSNNIKKLVGDKLFAYSDIEEVTFSNQLEEIAGDYAFFGTNLVNVTFPDTLNKIGIQCFHSCKSLESIKLPKNLDEIPTTFAAGCKKLKTVTFPEGEYLIRGSAFAGCGFEELNFGNNVKMNSNYSYFAFNKNENLKKVVCGEGVVQVPALFQNCPKLDEVYLSDKVDSIKISTTTVAFSGCTALREIHYAGTMSQWSLVNKETDWYCRDCNIETVICSDGNITLDK